MSFNLTVETPPPDSLAVNVPAGGLHEYDQAVLESGYFWANVAHLAHTSMDMGTFLLAKSIAAEMGRTLWLVSDGGPAPEQNTDQQKYIERFGERDRRCLLGVLAVSDVMRLLRGSDPDVFLGLEDGIGLKKADIIVDLGNDSAWSSCSVHLPAGDVDQLLGYPLGDVEERWYVNEKGLYIKRTPYDLSDTMRFTIEMEGYRVPDDMQTLFPYLGVQAIGEASSE